MIKRKLRGAAIAAITIFALAARAQDSGTGQAQYPIIVQQPEDDCVLLGSTVTFTVAATNVDSFQWYDNNVLMDGQTNSTLTISNAAISDVGYYTAVAIKGEDWVPTRAANFNVYTVSRPVNNLLTTTTSATSRLLSSATSSLLSPLAMGSGTEITVYAIPAANGGNIGSCPGKFAGSVSYTKTSLLGWGWAPSTNTTVHTATDGNQTNTKVQYSGMYLDKDCNLVTVTVPDPTSSPVYRFTIYFPTNTVVPTNAYPITLTGFDP